MTDREQMARGTGAVSDYAIKNLAIRSPLNRAIYGAVRRYTMTNMCDADDHSVGYPLVDLMSNPAPADIGTGEMEMVALADEIEAAVSLLCDRERAPVQVDVPATMAVIKPIVRKAINRAISAQVDPVLSFRIEHRLAEKDLAASDAAIEIIATLTPSLQTGGWKPIETAPLGRVDDDEPTLLLLFEPHDMGGFVFVGTYSHVYNYWFNNLDQKEQHPTHWMPLPAAPLSPTPSAPDQPAPSEGSGEAVAFQAIHNAMADERNGIADGDIIVKGCEAAGYCDPESAADSFKAEAAKRVLAALSPIPDAAVPGENFQSRVQPWLLTCFGEKIAGDREERNHRFLEEALELVQACGCSASEAHQLVDYVFGRPVGELHQEVGGVMVTLAALCLANDADMHAAGWVELDRIWGKVEAIRAKQAAKPKHSPLPQHVAAPVPATTGADVERLREALEPFATHLEEMQFDRDNHGSRG